MTKRFLRRTRRTLPPPKPTAPAAPTRQLFIDDDAFGDIEVLPAAMADWCAHEIRKIAAFAARHEAPDSMGWTDVYVRRSAPRGIADLSIPRATLEAVIGGRLPRFDEVVTGSSTFRVRVGNAWAYGPSSSAAVVLFGREEQPNVTSIELVLHAGGADASAVFAALDVLPSPEPLMVVDWLSATCVRLDHLREVERYLQQLDG